MTIPVPVVSRVFRVPRHVARTTALAVALALWLLPAPAQANGIAVIHDCLNHGRITGHYTQAEYAQALSELDGDTAEYSNCPTLIRQAMLAALAASRSGKGASASSPPAAAPVSSAPPNQAETAAIKVAEHPRHGPVSLGNGVVVTPDRARATISGAVSTLPGPLLATVLVVLAAAFGTLLRPLIRYVRARRPR